MNSKITHVKPTEFGSRFMNHNPSDSDVLKLPIQIHRIEDTAKHLKIPAPLHRPEFNFVVHLVRGTAKQQVDTEVISLRANDILFVKQGQITALLEVRNVAGYIIVFEESSVNQLLSQPDLINIFSSENKIKLTEDDSKWINTLFDLVYKDFYSQQRSVNVCRSLFQAGLLKIIANKRRKEVTVDRAAQITFLFKELAYKSQLKTKSINFFSNELAVSENYLNRCVKKTLGISPKEWITRMSIAQGQLLLKDSTMSIAEIAFQLNYDDPSYFGRLFKKYKGITPSEYRESTSRQDLSD